MTKTLPVRDPRTGDIELTIEVTSPEQVAAKAARLRENQKVWGALSIAERVAVMSRWSDVVAKRARELGEIDAADTGGVHTSYMQGYITLGNIGGWVEDAEAALARAHIHARSVSMPDVEVRSQLVPYPLVGVISPWNAPMMLGLLDAVPALFAGSAVLWKPSEVTPRFLGPLFDSVAEVPELAAVFDYVIGDGPTGQHVIRQADMICFTGSVPTGRKVAVACAERLIPCYLELGGKDPVIVTENADIDRATTAVLRGGVYATGQVCYSVERVYVHESIHDRFVEELVRKAEQVRLNDGDPRAGHIGPFISVEQPSIVEAHLADAVVKGARILTGGRVESLGGGKYMRPTVLTDVNHRMTIMQEETFGPTLPVMRYRTVDEAVELANDTVFGLTASVIAADEDEALPIARRINAGSVFVQDTFLTFGKLRTIGTNSFGHSGLGGARTGPDAIMRFVRRKALMTNHGSAANILDDRHPQEEGA